MREIALYQGDKFIDLGTVEELASKFGVKDSSIYYLTTPAYKRKVEKRQSKKALLAYILEESEIESMFPFISNNQLKVIQNYFKVQWGYKGETIYFEHIAPNGVMLSFELEPDKNIVKSIIDWVDSFKYEVYRGLSLPVDEPNKFDYLQKRATMLQFKQDLINLSFSEVA